MIVDNFLNNEKKFLNKLPWKCFKIEKYYFIEFVPSKIYD